MGELRSRERVFPAATPWVIGLATAVLLAILSIPAPMGNDEGQWSYIARVWVENGLPPYVSAIENKTPGVFELFAVSHMLFGTTAAPVRALGILALVATSVLVYRIVEELAGGLGAVVAMTTFGLTMGWGLMDVTTMAHTESFMVFFSTLPILLLIRAFRNPHCRFQWRAFFCGLSLGLAIHFKQIAVFSVLGWLGLLFVGTARHITWKRKVVAALVAGVGAVSALTVATLPLFLSGATFNDYLEGAWLILFNKGSSFSVAANSNSSASAAIQCLGARLGGFLATYTASRIVLFYPFLLLLICNRELRRNRLFLGIVIWGVCEFIGSNASGYYYGHQLKQAVPALAIVLGVVLGQHLRDIMPWPNGKRSGAMWLLALLIVLWFPYDSACNQLRLAAKRLPDTYRDLGVWLGDHSDSGDYVYVAGEMGSAVLSQSGRLSSSRHFNTIFITTEAAEQEVLRDLAEKPPVCILMSTAVEAGHLKRLADYVHRNYKASETKGAYIVWLPIDRTTTEDNRQD